MNTDDRVKSLLLLWQEEHLNGRNLSASELCRAFPELEAELAERIRILGHMAGFVRPTNGIGEPVSLSQAETNGLLANGTPANEGADNGGPDGGDAASVAKTLPTVPGYDILGELGRGGMGVVYKARQIKLNRIVALKMILSGAHAGAEASARFLQEAETIARLKHPNIVQVYDFGTSKGLSFFSLEFVEGGSLSRRLHGEPQPPMQAAALVETVARAIQVAHDQRVIHRDLKPGNVLMGADGAPKVTDFGLAKQIDSGLTATGAVMGTPSYMAPEQAAGNTKEIGPAVDVYALGTILYEMLTGRAPFRGVSAWETVQMVVWADPVPPRQVNTRVPRDLETICLKCLQKEPQRRYGSADELADDLRRFQTGEPIQGRPTGSIELVWKWARRRPAVAVLAILCIVAGLSSVGIGLWFSAEMGAAGVAIKAKEERARDAERLAQTHEFFGLVRGIERRSVQPQPGWTWANLNELRKAAALTPASEHLQELRSEAALAMGAIDVRETAAIAEGVNAASLAFHPDGSVLAIGPFSTAPLLDGTIQLVDVRTRVKRRDLTFRPELVLDPDHGLVPEGIFSLAFSPDGRFLVAGARSGMLHCWDLSRESSAAVSWEGAKRRIDQVCFNPDGTVLFTGANTIRGETMLKRWVCSQWGAAGSTPKCDRTWTFPTGFRGFACHPIEGWLICSTASGWTNFLSGETLQPLRPAMKGRSDQYVQFTPHGDAFVGEGLHLTSLRDDRPMRTLSPPDGGAMHVSSVAFNHASTLLASVSNRTKHVKLWEVASGRMIADLFVPGAKITVAAFCPDSGLLAVTADKKTVLYEIGGLKERTYVAVQPQSILGFGLHPDGRSLACQSNSLWTDNLGDVTIWPLEERAGFGPSARNNCEAMDAEPLVCFQPGSQLMAWGAGGRLHFQDSAGLTKRRSLHEKLDPNGLTFGPDGRLWGTVGPELRVWDAAEAKQVLSWDTGLTGHISGLATLYAVSVGKRWAAVGGRDGTVHLFHAAVSGKKGLGANRHSGPTAFKAPVGALALNPDETLVAAGSDKGDLCLLRVPEGKLISPSLAHGDEVKAVAWSAGGLLASGSHDRTVKLWTCVDGQLRELLTLRQPAPVRGLAFHPDGVRLFVLLEREGAVRVWHLDRLFSELADMGLGHGLEPVSSIPLPSPAPPPLSIDPVVEKPTGPNGLKEEWFADMELRRCIKISYRHHLDANAVGKAADPSLAGAQFSMRCTGWLKAPSPGKYLLELESRDGAKLWLDGKRLFDRWQSSPGKHRVEVELSGQLQALRLEFFNLTGDACIHFRWAQNGKTMQRVPAEALFHEMPRPD